MKRSLGWIRTIAAVVAGLVVLTLVLAWLSGAFEHKTPPGRTVEPPTAAAVGNTFEVRAQAMPRVVKAVGTVRAVHETAIGSRLLAKVRKVHVAAGQHVEQGDVLIELDKTDIEARLSGAQANVDAAQSRLAQARSDLEKITQMRGGGAATPREFDDATRNVEVVTADLLARRHALEEVQAQLGYARITAPITGTIIEKLVEEGDLAQPGRTLVTLYDQSRLQLVASVPERLAIGLRVGQNMSIELDAIGQTCGGAISEIVPQASAATRSMTVKVTGDCPPGVVTGMFGRLLIPDGEEDRLLVPAAAVRRVGQLEMVQITPGNDAGAPEQRLVRTGERFGEQVEVLSGLTAGEKVLVP